MGILVKTVGYGGTLNNLPTLKRSVGLLSDGTVVAMIVDNNQTGITGDGGDDSGLPKIHFYHSSNRTSWTSKAVVNFPAAGNPKIYASMCVDSADNIHVIFKAVNGSLQYFVLTKGAGYTWTPSALTQVAAAPSGGQEVTRLDIDSIANSTSALVVVAFFYDANLGTKKAEIREYVRTTGGTWVTQTAQSLISGDTMYSGTEDVSVAADSTPVGGDNVGCYAYNATRKSTSGTDYGDAIYFRRVNVVTGARVSAKTSSITPFNQGLGSGYRHYWMFNTGPMQFTMAGTINASPWTVSVYRFQYNTGPDTLTTVVPLSNSANLGDMTRYSYSGSWSAVAMAGNDKIVFFARSYNTGVYCSVATVGASTVTFQPGNQPWDDKYRYGSDNIASYVMWSGATRNWAADRVDLLMYFSNTTLFPSGTVIPAYRVESRSKFSPLAPTNVKPAASSTVTTDRPQLAAQHKMATKYAQARTKMEWQLATDAGFTTNLRTVTEADADLLIANLTIAPDNAVVTTTEVMSQLSELFQGTWYVRARGKDEAGANGPYSGSGSFTVTHPPVPSNLYPTSGVIFAYGISGNASFSWQFTDPSPYDSQTAYQIVVEESSTGAVLVDSGKVLSTAKVATLAIPIGGKDIELRWKIKLWDSDDVAGVFSSYQLFFVSDAPTPGITAPGNGAVLSTGVPVITWTSGTGGIKTQSAYRVTLTQGAVVIHDSGWLSGANTSYQVSAGFLVNGQAYTITVAVRDNLDLEGSTSISVSTSWTPPAGPNGGWKVYVSEYAKRSFVYVTWSGLVVDPDFVSWNVYRRRVGEAQWFAIGAYSSADRLAHKDYLAGSGNTYEYAVTQLVDRFGDLIESTVGSTVQVTVNSDNYWLIDPLVPARSIPLFIVTGESFAEEYEQQTYSVIGRGRHVDYGDRLGYAGSIACQLRDKAITGVPKHNFALNPSFSLVSAGVGLTPDAWTLVTGGTVGEVTQDYLDSQTPAPFGGTPFRVKAGDMGIATTDFLTMQQKLTGANLSPALKVAGTQVSVSYWVANLPTINLNKRYRLVVEWLDAVDAVIATTDSGPLDPSVNGMESYILPTDPDGLAGNTTQVWWRLGVTTVVPGTVPTSLRVSLRLQGSGSGSGTAPAWFLLGGVQVETDYLTPYFDGDQIGSDWTGAPYLSASFTPGYYVARAQRLAIEEMKSLKSSAYLRNPFGDIWKVATGNISVSRIPGVGKSEFVNVEIPYEEVSF